MDDDRRFYRVVTDTWRLPLPDHLEQGYEDMEDFLRAVRRLVDRWRGREGECIGERNGHLRLRFHDTPGGVPDEAWLPPYILRPIDPPEEEDSASSIEMELDRAFGFD